MSAELVEERKSAAIAMEMMSQYVVYEHINFASIMKWNKSLNAQLMIPTERRSRIYSRLKSIARSLYTSGD